MQEEGGAGIKGKTMDFLTFISVFILTYLNSRLAQRKGQKHVLWALVTLVAMFTGYTIFAVALMLPHYELLSEDPSAAPRILGDPLRSLILYFGALGGYLGIRYLLERMPDSREGEENRD